jgi:hypothetical protein
VRKYIYDSPVLDDKQRMIADALEVFLAGFEGIFGSAAATSSPLPAGERSKPKRSAGFG